MASEGLFGRACEALTSNGLHDKSDNIVDTLKAPHPRGAPVAPHAIELPEVDEFDITAIKAALDSFPKLVGGGRFGLRPQHLKDAAGCKSPIVEDFFLGKLTRVVNMLAGGEGLPEITPYLAGASLVAGKKMTAASALSLVVKFCADWLANAG